MLRQKAEPTLWLQGALIFVRIIIVIISIIAVISIIVIITHYCETKTEAANEVTLLNTLKQNEELVLAIYALPYSLHCKVKPCLAGESQGWLACIWSGPQKLSAGYLHSHKKV